MVGPRRAAFVEESAEVEVLYANLDKMKSLTKKIQSSLSRLETSGKAVDEAIGPVYGNTQKLQTMNGNIDRIMTAIGHMREPININTREERILRSNPQQVGFQEYMASIDRTRQALRDMKKTNLRSNQDAISQLNGLLTTGCQQLEEVFRTILRDGENQVEPLHYITKNVEFPRLNSNKASQLRMINSYVSSSTADMAQTDSNTTATARIYADVRGQYLTSSLQNLASACVSTARRQNTDKLHKRGDNAINMYTSAIVGMYKAEYDNICPIFARQEWSAVQQSTCQSSVSGFANALSDLDRHIKENVLTECFLAYEIVEVVSHTSMQLENQSVELKQSMTDAVKPIRETAKGSLSTILGDIRSKTSGMTQVPQDAAGVPLTSEVMTRLQLMTDYLVPLSSILTSLGDGGWTHSGAGGSSSSVPTLRNFDVGSDGKTLFAHYANDTIETLLNGLEARARTLLKSKSAQGVFLQNNVAMIDRMIRSSELASLLGSSQSKLDVWRKKSSALYLDSWKETSAYLLDVQYTNRGPRPPSTGQSIDSSAVLKSLSSKDKDAIKEKFRSFNTSFDDAVAKHKSYRMEPEVRVSLARDVQLFIDALYGRFWDRYHDVDKGKGKYVKYDKSQLNAVLSGLG